MPIAPANRVLPSGHVSLSIYRISSDTISLYRVGKGPTARLGSTFAWGAILLSVAPRAGVLSSGYVYGGRGRQAG
jgi:hypothetical protein